MRIVLISDTHLRHPESLPEGDVLVHAGDLTVNGSIPETQRACDWLRSQPHAVKIFVPGNHDWLHELQPALAREMAQGLVFLHDASYELDGVHFYGSGWTPEFMGWAFNVKRGDELREVWSRIPDGVNVLVTHGPPAGIMDVSPYSNTHEGCADLLERVHALPSLKLHVFGHLHSGYGVERHGDVLSVNAALCDEKYRLKKQPVVVDTETWEVVIP